MRRTNRNEAVLRARALRRCFSLPEGLLWQVLRERPGGFKFRLQHPLDPYTLDFYCAAAKLAVEVDGESHGMGDRPQRDARRDRWLQERGIRVIRFAAGDVMKDLESAVTAIVVDCRQRVPPHRLMGRGTTRRVVEG
jgi:very-short-patch-repair endonuclease